MEASTSGLGGGSGLGGNDQSNHAASLMAELASAKTQEQCLMQMLSRCSGFLNKLRIEELQLSAIMKEERDTAADALQNGVLTPNSVLTAPSSAESEQQGQDSIGSSDAPSQGEIDNSILDELDLP